MSMIRQLAALIVAVVALAIGGSAVVGVSVARESLESQWQARNGDAATLLALALSQHQGDLDLMRVVLAAQADAGHYRSIRFRVPDGQLLFERTAPLSFGTSPEWLAALLPLDAPPGVAIVSDGWRQVGRVEVQSHPAWAYDSLWAALRRITAWLLLLGIGALAAAALAVRAWRRGLEDVVAQAHALEQGRFATIAEPHTRELQRLAGGMNAMVRRVHALFEAQTRQLESAQRQAQCDALTGLSNRAHFVAQLERALVSRPDAAALADGPQRGALVIIRLQGLQAMNARIGRDATDRLLASIGDLVRTYPERVEGAFAGRLNGSDLGLYLPVNGVAKETVEALAVSLQASLSAVDPAARLAIGAVDGLATGGVSDALARADEALARAEAAGPWGTEVVDCQAGAQGIVGDAIGESRWRERIAQALAAGRVQLAEYPVVDAAGRLLHLECPLRLQGVPGGPYDSAARWLPMAARSRLMQRVDLAAIELALGAIAQDQRPRSVHVAAESLADPTFVHEVARRLAAAPAASERLALEVSEAAMARPQRLAQASALWRPTGVRIGLENAGSSLRMLLEAQGFGIDYLKVDGRFLRGVAADRTMADYAGQLLATARGAGVTVYAEGIDDDADLRRLWELEFAGATGPAVRAAG
jgi:predicted signal transduction protein with EAL and GGDEF domain